MGEIRKRCWKVELAPTADQARIMGQWCGHRRWVYNWGLERCKALYEAGEKYPGAYGLSKELTQVTKDPDLMWLSESPATARAAALDDLDKAFKAFWRRLKRGEKPGYPRFKSRNDSTQSFRLRRTAGFDGRRIHVSKLGWVNVKERGYLPCAGSKEYCTVTILKRAGKWFAAVAWEKDIESKPVIVRRGDVKVVGDYVICVDDGQHKETVELPRPLRSDLRKLKRLSRRLSRREKDSANRLKARLAFQRFHYRVTEKRTYHLHTLTTRLVSDYGAFVVHRPKKIELDLDGADRSCGEFFRQLKYKSEWYGRTYEERVVDE